ncbi:MAG: hypothetical protein B6U76_00840 [Desulfurococcales archaeon ex4484_217_2]|nr:MAG: hypothetical protein B6U76_00840 [Desulfurococcales archaeon ex4484_217_2]
MVARYILPLSLQLKWIKAAEKYSCEWIAGLKLKGETIEWFGFTLGSESEVKPVSLKGIPKSIGTVHFHPYKHTETPIPSIEDGINWVYHSYWEIADELNPIFFIVFKDKYASWTMFPKPPIIRKTWQGEYIKVKDKEKASINLCLKLLNENTIKTGIFHLGKKDQEFKTF